MYPVVGGTTHAGRAAYAVLSGLTRKIKAGYAVRGGVHRQFFSAGPQVSFTGTHTISDITISGAAYKLYTLTGSGTLSVGGNGIRYWMCGGGAGGGTGIISDATSFGGRGGGGGYSTGGTLITGEYVVQIASGGQADADGADTICGNVTAKGGHANGNGGSGGGAQVCAGYHASASTTQTWVEAAGTGAGVSTYPFGISGLYPHCAGGASASAFSKLRSSATSYRIYGCNGGSNGENGSNKATEHTPTDAPSGGIKGGGNGAISGNGGNGTFYGAGAGGGYAYRSANNKSTGTGGAGYQGVVYVLVPAA